MYIDLNKYSLDGRFTCGKWDIICLINCYIFMKSIVLKYIYSVIFTVLIGAACIYIQNLQLSANKSYEYAERLKTLANNDAPTAQQWAETIEYISFIHEARADDIKYYNSLNSMLLEFILWMLFAQHCFFGAYVLASKKYNKKLNKD